MPFVRSAVIFVTNHVSPSSVAWDVTGYAGLALSDLLVDRYRLAGLTDITYRIHHEARHELFNETNRTEVEGDLLARLERVLAHIENERVLL